MRHVLRWILASCCFGLSALAVEVPVLEPRPGSDWIDVKKAGAVGDGKTDDTAALQKVMAGIKTGTVVYFPPGEYVIRESLVIVKTPPFDGKEKRLLGVNIHGHGRASVLRWDGADDGVMVRDRGLLHHRMTGLVFDGAGKAAIGVDHDNDNKFETHLQYKHVAFRNFRRFGMHFVNNKQDGLSTAEIAFIQCAFDACGTGVSFTSFNDYNYTFDGCDFRNNARMAVECVNGNFYIRNTRFENNALDVFANPEHVSSIRRSVSAGSGRFLRFVNGVSPMTLESNRVADWKEATAIEARGAPLTLFDNVFTHADPGKRPLGVHRAQCLLLANNAPASPEALCAEAPENVTVLDAPANPVPTLPAVDAQFIASAVPAPGRLFDARSDFGAKGDGKADDTEALQRCIDAARAAGGRAIAYFPFGRYRITQPLQVTGADYALRGSGSHAQLWFAGDVDADAVQVRPSGELTLADFAVKREGVKFDNRELVGFAGAGADIRQFPSADGSRVNYDTVYVAGKYVHIPFHLGFRLENLGPRDLVVLDNIEGNVHADNSGAATIYLPVSYEGTVSIKGKAAGGLFAIQSRLATLSKYSLHVEDSQSVVATDFYIEQAQLNTVTLKGHPDDAPGRATLSFSKLDVKRVKDGDRPGILPASGYPSILSAEGYRGDLSLQAQLYAPKDGLVFRIQGNHTRLGLWGSYFYTKHFGLEPADYPLSLIGSSGKSEWNQANLELKGMNRDPALAIGALGDLRRVGALDWSVRYPGLAAVP